MRGATDVGGHADIGSGISIHAPREGSDGEIDGSADGAGISIHAPREGSDGRHRAAGVAAGQFQSTLPVRGATQSA